MKKIYFLSFLLLFIGKTALCAPLSGTYTIGGTSPNYATFNLAVTALASNGVSGPVIFNARAGTYTEQITITDVTGVSSGNTVTFQSETGNAADVTLTYAATGTGNNWVVNLSGCSYIIFNEMTIQATGSTYSDGVIVDNSATYDKLTDLIITGPVVTVNNNNQTLVNLTEDGSCTGYCGVYGCTFNNGCYGAYNNFGYSCGQSYNYGMVVENNTFTNQYAGGIYENRCLTGASIEFNTITSNSTDTAYMGIYVNIQEDTVCCNKITNCPGTGIYFGNCSPYIFNNFVEITGSAANYGIEFDWDNYCANYIFITSNSVLVLNTNSVSAAFYMIWPGYAWNFQFNNLTDNVFVNRGGGYAISIADSGSVINMDYNDYYTSGPYIGAWGENTGIIHCTTLANWQATITGCHCGGDAHSKNINPSFVSNTNLDLTFDDLRFGIITPFQAVWPTDINGTQRNAATPDIGAEEFSLTAPVALFAANKTSICAGDTVQFTDTSTGAPNSWNWTFTGGTPGASNSQNPSVTYNTAGNYNVKLVVTNGIRSDSLVKTGYITVNAAAVAGNISASPDSVCSGGPVQFSATGSAGNLQWQLSITNDNFQNIGGATDSSNVVEEPASFYFRAVATNGNCSDTSSSQPVTVNPLPMPSPVISTGDSLICSSDSTLITLNSTYSSYSWNTGDTANDIYVNAGGGYWVTVTNTYNCSAISNQVNVSVFPVPSVSLEVNGDTLSSLNAVAYQWYHGDTAIMGATNPFYIVKQTGYYSVQITDTNGCKTQSTQQYITVTGIKNLVNSNDISVYPNPFGNKLFIQRNNTGTKWGGIEIYDVLGQSVMSEPGIKTTSNTIELDVSALPAGLYYVEVTTGEAGQVWKVMKQ